MFSLFLNATGGQIICVSDVTSNAVKTYVLHFAVTDGSLWSSEHVTTVYIQSIRFYVINSSLNKSMSLDDLTVTTQTD